MITLAPLTADDMEQVRKWRHQVPETLRTPYMLTAEMQRDYYERVICNRESRTRYWALHGDVDVDTIHHLPIGAPLDAEIGRKLIGYGGIENIEWENGCGEISLLIAPGERGKGYGREAVTLFLDKAFDSMRLATVHGECYECGPWQFWEKMLTVQEKGEATWLPMRKYWRGAWHRSFYFTFFWREG